MWLCHLASCNERAIPEESDSEPSELCEYARRSGEGPCALLSYRSSRRDGPGRHHSEKKCARHSQEDNLPNGAPSESEQRNR